MDFKFNPENKFIEHPDPQHKYSLEKQEFDFEYQREFRDFITIALHESNIETSEDLLHMFDVALNIRATEIEPRSVYIESSEYLKSILVSEDPGKRLELDRELEERFHLKFVKDIENENFSHEELHKIISKTFLEKVDLKKLIDLMEKESDVAKKNILLLIIQIIDREAIPRTENEVELNTAEPFSMIDIPGTCVKAEKHMLTYLSGKYGNPDDGYTNLILDNQNKPLMLEKMGRHLGDSFSCVSLKPVRIDGVLIPAGAIFGSVPCNSELKTEGERSGGINYIKNLKDYEGFMFLRMSLFSLPEKIRASAGGSYYSRQQEGVNWYTNYDWITPEVIAEYAEYRLKQEGK